MKRLPITTIDRIMQLVAIKGCVWNERLGRHEPAAFLQNQQARVLQNSIDLGIYFEYKKPEIPTRDFVKNYTKNKKSNGSATQKRNAGTPAT